ncbi:sulfur carrier protein ThiS [Secundilactobacillus folii]|uniref:Sulfur carrier protein ThiS n=1 Tax=Secundilactobacillus folii TaxID=2678357 RepID=A0A7X2XTA3_9LACO|nr:sulfur carrier protein ThiS [Secundilactobacillus folii]MTV81244.1 sulfur carrier protein ThiS [Secundilactobacillus folii]
MVIVNGEPVAEAVGLNIQTFLEQRQTPVDHVVVELNGHIIHRPEFENTTLSPNDKLELITFVGGGR